MVHTNVGDSSEDVEMGDGTPVGNNENSRSGTFSFEHDHCYYRGSPVVYSPDTPVSSRGTKKRFTSVATETDLLGLSMDDMVVANLELRKKLQEAMSELGLVKNQLKVAQSMSRKIVRLKSYSQLQRTQRHMRIKEGFDVLMEICNSEQDFLLFYADLKLYIDRLYEICVASKMSGGEGLYCLKQFNLSWNKMQKLKSFLSSRGLNDPFPSMRLVVERSQFLSWKSSYTVETHLVDHETASSKQIMVIQLDNIGDYVAQRIHNLHSSDLLTAVNNTIRLGVCGDKGGEHTRFTLMIGDILHPNSVRNHTIIGMFNDNDVRENVLKYLSKMVTQLNNLKIIEITINGVKQLWTVELFLIGDLKFQLSMCGLKSASSNHPCLWCEHEKFGTIENWDHSITGKERSVHSCVANGLSETKGMALNSRPVFDIPIRKRLPPCLHIILALGKIATDELNQSAIRVDSKVDLSTGPEYKDLLKHHKNLEHEIAANKDKKKELEVGIKQLKIVKSIYTSMDNNNYTKQQPNKEDRCSAGDLCVFTDKRLVKTMNEKEHSWVECSKCVKWVHHYCCGLIIQHTTSIKLSTKVLCFDCSLLSLQQRVSFIENEINESIILLNETIELLEENVEQQDHYKKNLISHSGDMMKQLDSIFAGMGADKSTYYQEFNGNQMKNILKSDNSIKLWSLFPQHPKRVHYIKYMQALSKLYEFTSAEELNDQQIAEYPNLVEELVNSLKSANPNQSVTPKIHAMAVHVTEFINLYGFWGKLSEQGIECIHARCHNLQRRYQSVKGKNHLLSIVNDIAYDNYLHDNNIFE